VPDTGWVEVSGEGEQALVAFHTFVTPTFLLAHIGTLTNPKVRVMGVAVPRRVQFGGSAGFGSTDLDQNGVLQVEYGLDRVLNFESLVWTPAIPASAGSFIDRMWWKLPINVTWWLKAFW
jgi:hypothetical protein